MLLKVFLSMFQFIHAQFHDLCLSPRLLPCIPRQLSLQLSPWLSESFLLYQDFLYFFTLLSLRSELCLSNNSSPGFLPAFVAAAVSKQVVDAI